MIYKKRVILCFIYCFTLKPGKIEASSNASLILNLTVLITIDFNVKQAARMTSLVKHFSSLSSPNAFLQA